MVTCSLLLILIVFICEINVNNLKLKSASGHNNDFKFKIIDKENLNVALNPPINSYPEGAFCGVRSQKIMNDSYFELTADFKDVETCINMNVTYTDCVVPCSSLDILIKFGSIMPQALYWALGIGTTEVNALNSESGEEVYGLETPPIYKELFVFGLTDSVLYVYTHICASLADKCTLKYNEVEFHGFYRRFMDGCSYESKLEYGIYMIPGYIYECPSYPKLFINTTQQIVYDIIEAHKPQFNVYYEEVEGQNNLFSIHFSKFYSDQMCHFSYRVTSYRRDNESTSSTPWISNCGNRGYTGGCYAICKDIKLLDESKTYSFLIDVKIRTRQRSSINSTDMIDRDSHISRGKIVWKRNYPNTLIVYKKDNNLFMNGTMVYLLYPHIRILRWGINYYFNPYTTTEGLFYWQYESIVICNKDGEGPNCAMNIKDDQVKLNISHNGAPSILRLFLSFGYNRRDTVYVVLPKKKGPTEKKFNEKKPYVSGSNILIKAVDGNAETFFHNIPTTCIYYVRPHLVDDFREANCDNNYVCRGYCNDTQTIVGLVVGESYDIKVLAYTGYGNITYDSIYIGIPPILLRHLEFVYERNETELTFEVKNLEMSHYNCKYVFFTFGDGEETHIMLIDFFNDCDAFIVKVIPTTGHYLLKIIFPKDTNDKQLKEVIEIKYIDSKDFVNLTYEFEHHVNQIKVTTMDLPKQNLECEYQLRLSSVEDDAGTLDDITSPYGHGIQFCEEIVIDNVEDTEDYSLKITYLSDNKDLVISKVITIKHTDYTNGGYYLNFDYTRRQKLITVEFNNLALRNFMCNLRLYVEDFTGTFRETNTCETSDCTNAPQSCASIMVDNVEYSENYILKITIVGDTEGNVVTIPIRKAIACIFTSSTELLRTELPVSQEPSQL